MKRPGLYRSFSVNVSAVSERQVIRRLPKSPCFADLSVRDRVLKFIQSPVAIVMSPANDQFFCAYEIHDPGGMKINAAPLSREWMENTDRRFAYRCLPLQIANTTGWFLANPQRFSVWWKGGNAKEDLVLEFPSGQAAATCIQSHFGHGILTFTLPYLFRTPRGINLWIKGPTNWPKDGIYPLEGIVETDWTTSTFTMNWKMTRPHQLVVFEQDEPICMVIPVARGLVESLVPVQQSLASNPEVEAHFKAWDMRRREFLNGLATNKPETVRKGWEKDYFKGIDETGTQVPDHQIQVKIKEFQKL